MERHNGKQQPISFRLKVPEGQHNGIIRLHSILIQTKGLRAQHYCRKQPILFRPGVPAGRHYGRYSYAFYSFQHIVPGGTTLW
jgi:hypothetical protein